MCIPFDANVDLKLVFRHLVYGHQMASSNAGVGGAEFVSNQRHQTVKYGLWPAGGEI